MSISGPCRRRPTCFVRTIHASAKVGKCGVIIADLEIVLAGREDPADEIDTHG